MQQFYNQNLASIHTAYKMESKIWSVKEYGVMQNPPLNKMKSEPAESKSKASLNIRKTQTTNL